MMMQALKSLKNTVRDMGKVADARDESLISEPNFVNEEDTYENPPKMASNVVGIQKKEQPVNDPLQPVKRV